MVSRQELLQYAEQHRANIEHARGSLIEYLSYTYKIPREEVTAEIDPQIIFSDAKTDDLSYGDFSYISAPNIDFSKTNLIGSKWQWTKLNSAKFSFQNNKALVKEIDFLGSDLSNASFQSCNLSKCSFRLACLTNVNFSEADLSDTILEFSNLREANFERANLQNSIVTFEQLKTTALTSTALEYLSEVEKDLAPRNLFNVGLSEANYIIKHRSQAVYYSISRRSGLYAKNLNVALEKEIEIFLNEIMKIAYDYSQQLAEAWLNHLVAKFDQVNKNIRDQIALKTSVNLAQAMRIAQARREAIEAIQQEQEKIWREAKEEQQSLRRQAEVREFLKTMKIHLPTIEDKKQYYVKQTSNVNMTPITHATARGIGKLFTQETKKDLVITSSLRTPQTTAELFYDRLKAGSNLSLYRNKDAIKEIKDAYDNALSNNNTEAEIVNKIAQVVSNQIAQNVFVSNHLQGTSIDVSIKGWGASDHTVFEKIILQIDGLQLIDETDTRFPHWHVTVKDTEKLIEVLKKLNIDLNVDNKSLNTIPTLGNNRTGISHSSLTLFSPLEKAITETFVNIESKDFKSENTGKKQSKDKIIGSSIIFPSLSIYELSSAVNVYQRRQAYSSPSLVRYGLGALIAFSTIFIGYKIFTKNTSANETTAVNKLSL